MDLFGECLSYSDHLRRRVRLLQPLSLSLKHLPLLPFLGPKIQNEIARDQPRLQICQTSTDINSTPLSLHGRLSALHCPAPMINIMKSPRTEYLAAISSPRLSQPRLQSQRRQAVSGDQRKKHILIILLSVYNGLP